MKHYCLFLLIVTAVRAWSLGHGSSDSKEVANMEPKIDGQPQYWASGHRPYFRIGRSAYRGFFIVQLTQFLWFSTNIF